MVKYYLLITLRNLGKNAGFSFLNLFGLTLAFVTSIFIFQYANFESSYDSFHTNKGAIYRIQTNQINRESGNIQNSNATSFLGLMKAIRDEVPEADNATHIMSSRGAVSYETRVFNESNVYYSNSGFFEIFSFPLALGNSADLDKPNTVFISQSMAKKYFGDANPIGKSIRYNDTNGLGFDLGVAGVFYDLPPNTQFQADFIVGMDDLEREVNANNYFGPGLTLDAVVWRWIQFYTYVKSANGVDPERLESSINLVHDKYREPFETNLGVPYDVKLQAIESVHLDPDFDFELSATNDKSVVSVFKLIGLTILIIAWINYLNLTTARIVNRGKEIGVKKVLGSNRLQLVTQFLIESYLFTFISLVLTAGLVFLMYPFFETLVGKPVFETIAYHSDFWLSFLLLLCVGAFVTGIYPASLILKPKTLEVIKGKFRHSKKGALLRKSLVTFQFCIATILICCIYVVKHQTSFMLNSDKGVNIEQTLVVDAPSVSLRSEAYSEALLTLKSRLTNLPSISEFTVSSLVPGEQNLWMNGVERAGPNLQNNTQFGRIMADQSYTKLYDIEIKQGRGFSDKFEGDRNVAVINDRAIRELGFDSSDHALGKTVVFPGNQTFTIVGIMEDYFQNGLQSSIAPLVLQLDTALAGNKFSMKFNANEAQKVVSNVEKEFKAFFPNAPFEYRFLEESFNRQYDSETRTGKIVGLFSLVAVIVAILGLVGLTSFTINQKRKEISIRKVLGSKASQVFMMINKEYLLLSSIAVVISCLWLST